MNACLMFRYKYISTYFFIPSDCLEPRKYYLLYKHIVKIRGTDYFEHGRTTIKFELSWKFSHGISVYIYFLMV